MCFTSTYSLEKYTRGPLYFGRDTVLELILFNTNFFSYEKVNPNFLILNSGWFFELKNFSIKIDVYIGLNFEQNKHLKIFFKKTHRAFPLCFQKALPSIEFEVRIFCLRIGSGL